MVRQKSAKAIEIASLLEEAVLGVRTGKYKSSYEAARQLGLCKETMKRPGNGGLTCVQACQKQ